MPSVSIIRECPVIQTPRVQQVAGMFDCPLSATSTEKWDLDINLPEKWNVGCIVGPSGAGKSTLARELFGKELVQGFEWPKDKSILDGFPTAMGIKDVVQLLSSVGFSSPPSWVRPFHVLSNGEQFRVTMARALAEQKELCVVDEFSSVIDRTTAQIGSAAIAKTVRKRGQRFVAVSCHYDILEWLAPNWIFEPHLNKLTLPRGSLQRPPIDLEICRVHSSAWKMFHRYHYLTATINPSAVCFVAFWQGTPVAFDAWLPFVGRLKSCVKARRGHRTVCLPDFQGVGIGNALFTTIASAWSGLGYRALSNTGHPAEINRRIRSKDWRMTSAPKQRAPDAGHRRHAHSTMRWMASFEYIGKPMDRAEAHKLIYGS
jgi:ABC-type ATPase involved in cell division